MNVKLLILIAAFAFRSTLAASGEITRDRAHHLAAAYFARYVSGCGGVEAPTLHGDHWEAPVRFGYAGTPAGAIHVDRSTGTVSYTWHSSWHAGPYPTVSAKDMEAWIDSLKKDSKRPNHAMQRTAPRSDA